MGKTTRILVADSATAACLWLWLVHGSTAIGVLLTVYAWAVFAFCLFFLSWQVRRNVGERMRAWRRRERFLTLAMCADVLFDVAVTGALAWTGHVVVAGLWLASALLATSAVFAQADGGIGDEGDPDWA